MASLIERLSPNQSPNPNGNATLTSRPAAARHRLLIGAALFAIYIVWGSTFLAIRIAVHELPPLGAAGLRFVVAGALLYAWTRFRGAEPPSARQWRRLSLLGVLMFLGPYSALFWAEQRLPSGIAAVLVATVPMWTVMLEMFVFRRQPPRAALIGITALGLLGVTVLSLDSAGASAAASADASGGGQSHLWTTLLPFVAVLLTQLCWATGTVLSTEWTLPKSKPLGAGVQMLTGGAMLLAASLLIGEIPPLPHVTATAAGAMAYLIVAGSLVGYTAYAWLLTQLPTMTVTSYAYVNPLVALAIGWSIGGEILTGRALLGAALVLCSTMLLLRARAK